MIISRYCKAFYQRLLKPFDPYGLFLQQAIKVALSVSIAALVCTQILKLSPAYVMCPLLASAFVPQMYRGITLKRRIIIQLSGAAIGAIMVLIASILSEYFWLYLLLMLFATWIIFYSMKYGADIFLPGMLILIFTLFMGGMPVNDKLTIYYRFIGFIGGSIWAIFISNILWPYRPRKLLQKNLKQGFQDLGIYLRLSVNNALRGNFQRLHVYESKNRVLSTLVSLRSLVDNYGDTLSEQMLIQQGKIFMCVVALSDLLSKPNSEYTLDRLEVISDELILMAKYISVLPQVSIMDFHFKLENEQSVFGKFIKNQSSLQLIANDIICLKLLLRKLNAILIETSNISKSI